jgi:glycosyltransferase involved in cell wall biosynthesis
MAFAESRPLITVIVAVFNGAATLQQCINSVAQQTYPNKELIIIDGGSTDGTVNLLKSNREKISYWISEPDRGIYSAWNKALAHAHGEWICFLGADDYFWDEQVLESVVVHMEKLPPDIRVVYGQVMLVNLDGESLFPMGEPWEKVKERFKHTMSIPHPGLMYRRSFFGLHGLFDESYRIAGDYELLLRELKKADAFFIPDLIITAMRQGGVSTNPENSLRALYENQRIHRMHGRCIPGHVWLMEVMVWCIHLLIWKLFGERTARRAIDMCRCMMGLPPYWTKI